MQKKVIRIGLIIFLILLFAPFIYSVYYSMPATDDYAWSIAWFSDNRIIEIFKRVGWNYMNWFGQSGVLAVVIQLLFNPLYWFNDIGHSFGICMVVIFIGLIIGLVIGIRRLASYLFEDMTTSALDIFTAIVIALLFTSYYYADVYNWWSGTPGYSLMMTIMIFAFGYIARYVRTGDTKAYKGMIITGIIACTGLMNCVAMGLFYLFMIFVKSNHRDDSLIKKIGPLLCYIASGLVTVIAPGNFKRTSGKGEGGPDYIESIRVTAEFINSRIISTLKNYPWVIALFIVIIIFGFACKTKNKPNVFNCLLGIILTYVASAGAIYPYILGERKAVGDELATRVNYYEDYILFIGFAFALFTFGRWLGYVITINIRESILVLIAGVVLVGSLFYAHAIGTFMYIVPYDIYRQRAVIKQIYYTWEGIIDEIETSEEDDVEIVRDNVPWTRFCYPVGIDEGSNFVPEDLREYYGGTNQCTEMWYGKNSIRVYIN